MKRTKRTIAPIGGPVRIASSCASCVKSENEKMKKIEEMKMKRMKFRVTGALVGTTSRWFDISLSPTNDPSVRHVLLVTF